MEQKSLLLYLKNITIVLHPNRKPLFLHFKETFEDCLDFISLSLALPKHFSPFEAKNKTTWCPDVFLEFAWKKHMKKDGSQLSDHDVRLF
jgi:hypothetical protein